MRVRRTSSMSIFAAVAVLAALSRHVAAATPPADAVQLPVVHYQLPNGLRVLVHEDHTVPAVSVNVWYFVGSKDERPGRTGFAHLFEHLMFQGSAHVGDDQHLALVAQAGGSANATTSDDRTDFFETLPSNYLELALFLESDRMGYLVDTLTQDKLDTQRGVVQNERRQTFENRPYGMAAFALREALYPESHPYHHLAIGSHSDLEAATLDDVKDFFRAWYTPENAVLCIAGDVNPARAKELVTRWFGALPSHAPPPRTQAPANIEDVSLAADKRMRLADKVSFERLYLTWPSPRWFAPGDAELDLLATVLGGRSGRLYERLVYQQRLAQGVLVIQSSAALGSQFQIVATAQAGHTAAELEAAVQAEIARLLGAEPVTDEELRRAKTAWEAQFVYGLEGYERRADMVNQYFDHFGEPGGFERDRDRYLKATREQVMKTAHAVLEGHKVALVVAPDKEPEKSPGKKAPAGGGGGGGGKASSSAKGAR
jgi:zinc protease